jgi:hypothetical protein
LILLSYNNNTKIQPIYIRQGEQPDWLFRNYNAQDAYDEGGLPTERTKSMRFSPYNLTDPTGYAGSTIVTDHKQLPIGGYTAEEHFTDYPTQSGYLFQWGQRYAYHPANQSNTYTTLPAAVTNYWDALTTPEACPSGYRQPIDGPTTGAATIQNSTSECLQSLWLYPQNGASEMSNAYAGFYADGFFDRRERVQPPGTYTAAGTSVSYHASLEALNKYIAHRGTLLINPNNLHSIFMPWTGERYHHIAPNLHLRELGQQAMFWARTQLDTNYAIWARFVTVNIFGQDSNNRNRNAVSIRCVLE